MTSKIHGVVLVCGALAGVGCTAPTSGTGGGSAGGSYGKADGMGTQSELRLGFYQTWEAPEGEGPVFIAFTARDESVPEGFDGLFDLAVTWDWGDEARYDHGYFR